MNDGDPIRCPIWHTKCKVSAAGGDYNRYDSWRAGGKYEITGSGEREVYYWDYNKRDQQRASLSQSILEANINGGILRLTTAELSDKSTLLRKRTYRENFDLLMRAIAQNHPGFGEEFFEEGPIDTDVPWEYAIAIGWPERDADRRLLMEVNEYVRFGQRQGLIRVEGFSSILTFEGHEYVENMGLSGNSADTIFVAMWFGSERTNRFFNETVRPAVIGAGYKCVRIDQEQHNDRIDERILAEIRKSRAVIADITCGLAKPIKTWSRSEEVGAPRGGVYFEAGFAAGLGIPIIWTLDQSIADVENVVHFDSRQYNQIRWGEDFEAARDLLQSRIIATLGKGRFYSSDGDDSAPATITLSS